MIFVSISVAATEEKTKDVISEGVGTLLEGVIKNSAENALSQVVGTFIASETQINKRKQIKDGIKSQTKTISTNMREYSQGSRVRTANTENLANPPCFSASC